MDDQLDWESVAGDGKHLTHIGGPGLREGGAIVTGLVDRDAVRDLVAILYVASGCSCCQDTATWRATSEKLAAILGVETLRDGSDNEWPDWHGTAKTAKAKGGAG